MRQFIITIACIALLACISSCGGGGTTSAVMTLTDPIDDETVLIIGCILVENVGVRGASFDWWSEGIEVLVLGKIPRVGEDVIQAFRAKTDKNGYFMIPNAPKGQYLLKGFVMYGVSNQPITVYAKWNNTKPEFFLPRRQELPIPEEAEFFPRAPSGRVYDLAINYFGIRHLERSRTTNIILGEAFYTQVVELKNRRLNLQISHTRQNPREYFKELFPTSSWFTL